MRWPLGEMPRLLLGDGDDCVTIKSVAEPEPVQFGDLFSPAEVGLFPARFYRWKPDLDVFRICFSETFHDVLDACRVVGDYPRRNGLTGHGPFQTLLPVGGAENPTEHLNLHSLAR